MLVLEVKPLSSSTSPRRLCLKQRVLLQKLYLGQIMLVISLCDVILAEFVLNKVILLGENFFTGLIRENILRSDHLHDNGQRYNTSCRLKIL